MIRSGIAESQLNQAVYHLAKEMYGISTYWHKRIVRAGANTLLPHSDNPPDHIIGDDDILFLDLGPVFANPRVACVHLHFAKPGCYAARVDPA